MMQHVQKRRVAPPWWSPVDREACICVYFPCVCHQIGISSCAVRLYGLDDPVYTGAYMLQTFVTLIETFQLVETFLFFCCNNMEYYSWYRRNPIIGSHPSGSKRSLHCLGNYLAIQHLANI